MCQLQAPSTRAAPNADSKHALRRHDVATCELMHARRISWAVELLREDVQGRQCATGEDDAVGLLQCLCVLRAGVQEDILQL